MPKQKSSLPKSCLNAVRQSNRAQIALTVHRHGPISRIQLAKLIGLSVTSVCTFVEELLEEGILIETGTVTGSRGRPMVMLDVNPEGRPTIGVSIAPDFVDVVVANPVGTILTHRRVLTDADETPDTTIDGIASTACRAMESIGKDIKSARGVGVVVCGLVDTLLGTIDTLPTRPGWESYPICRSLEDLLGLPVYVENDVRAGALASQWFEEQERDGGALYVSISTGIGSAYADRREVLRGASSAAGELGHMTMDVEGPLCGCGNRGCLEALASDKAFICSLWPEHARDFDKMSTSDRAERVMTGLQLAMQGDHRANETLTRVVKYLGAGIANAIAILNPHTVFVGGTIIDAVPNYVIDLVRKETLKRVLPKARNVEIRASSNYEAFLIRGAIGLVLWQPYMVLHERALDIGALARVDRKLNGLRRGQTGVTE